MKHLATFLFFFLSIQGFCQEKTNYNKDVYPLIKDGKYTEAIPLLEQFLSEKPTHVNANYWYAKIMESEGKRLSDPTMIDKAKTHYLTCSKNVTELDMTMATAGRFPDVTGLESIERLQNFQALLNKKNGELTSLKENIIRENDKKKYEAEKIELQRKKQIEEDAKIKVVEFSEVTIEDFVAKTGLTELKKILGSYGESLSEGEKDWNFKYEFNTIDGKPTINGKISGDFRGQLDNFEGELHSGNGYIVFYFDNMDIYATQAIKFYINQNKCVKLRCETLFGSSELFNYETTDVDAFEAERFLDITDNPYEVKAAGRKVIGNRHWPIAKFQGYFDSEEEGADIIMKGISFLPVIKKNGQYYLKEKQIIILEENIKADQISSLKNAALVDKYFELNCEAYQYESEIFLNQDSIFSLINFKEVQIFTPDSYAANYKEVVSAESLNSLNVIAKKWHESLVNGNYEAFKTVCTKYKTPSIEEFKKMHSSYSGFPNSTRYKFQKSNDYLVAAADFFILFDKDFLALKNSVCDMTKTIALIGVYQEKRGENYERNGDLVFINENGAWKVLYLLSEDINKDDLKAFQALTKEKITPCGCIEKIINGDVYNTEKCAFFFRYKKLENESQAFDACFKTLNYCDYQKQRNEFRKELGPNFFGYSNSDKSRECLGQ